MVRRPDADGSSLQSETRMYALMGNANARCRVAAMMWIKHPPVIAILSRMLYLMTFSFLAISPYLHLLLTGCGNNIASLRAADALYAKLRGWWFANWRLLSYTCVCPVFDILLTHLAQLRR